MRESPVSFLRQTLALHAWFQGIIQGTSYAVRCMLRSTCQRGQYACLFCQIASSAAGAPVLHACLHWSTCLQGQYVCLSCQSTSSAGAAPVLQAIIYVVDSSDTERIGTSAEEFHAILDEEELRDALILVYANKQARTPLAPSPPMSALLMGFCTTM